MNAKEIRPFINLAEQKLEKLCKKLNTSSRVRITSGKMFEEGLTSGVIRSYPIESMIAASIYIASLKENEPLDVKDLSIASNVSVRLINQSYRILKTRLRYTS